MATRRLQADPIFGLKSHGKGFGLPSPVKYQSGHLPSGAIPGSRTIPVSMKGSGRGADSDMDTGSDSDDEVYGWRYSLESSPQDDKIPHEPGWRYNDSVHGNATYVSTQAYTELSSNGARVKQNRGNGFVNGGFKNAMRPSVSANESSGSEILSAIRWRSKLNQGTCIPEGYDSSACLQPDANTVSGQVIYDKDVTPSAPPPAGSVPKVNHVKHGMALPENLSGSAASDVSFSKRGVPFLAVTEDSAEIKISEPSTRPPARFSSSVPARFPTFHASGLGPWYAVISYDACVRLCLHSWARGCMEPPIFLDNECALLRDAFGLQPILLPAEEELLKKKSAELVGERAALKPKRTFGLMKVQVRKVRMELELPHGCSFSSLKPYKEKVESIRSRLSIVKSTFSSEWDTMRKVRVAPHIPTSGSFARQSLAYLHAGTQYIKEVSGILKSSLSSLRNSSSTNVVQETYSCMLRMKSSSEEDAVRMQPGSGETHVFLPDGLGDNLIIEVHDSKGKYCGRVVAQVAEIADDPSDKLRWWSIYHEPEHELFGRVQLHINYSTSLDESSHLKCGSVAETVAYDLVLEAAMKAQNFQQRNLLLHGSWKWLVTEFAVYYGVSDSYTRLRYISYVMDVATPTADCLDLVYELLLPVVMKSHTKRTLSHQENRMLGEVSDQIEQIIALVFENYKSIDESLPSGLVDIFTPATGQVAPALAPALKLYNLLNDILSPEAQLKLCRYFQIAAKKRSGRHLAETDEFVSSNNDNTLLDPVAFTNAYQKMKTLCMSIKNEISTDIEIHNQDVLPSFIDLPSLSSSIYSTELCVRMRGLLVACPPTGLSPAVAELLIAAADFQRDLASWKISSIKGGVDAKELFHNNIMQWIRDKRLALLESCKLDKMKWTGIRTQHSTTPFVDEMYDHLKDTMNEYEVITNRWPEYIHVLENAIADVEKAIVESLDKLYADALLPLKENAIPIKRGLKYVQKITKGTVCMYTVPDELGILLNSLKRMLDVLRPKIEAQLKSWSSCIPDSGNAIPGETLSEVTVMLRTKFRNYLQAVIEKLAENTRRQNATKLKKIIFDAKEITAESDVRNRMQPLKELLINTIDYLHNIFEKNVFLIICRGLWDRLGQDVLKFLENRKESRTWYRWSRVAISVLDDTFASQMQQLLGNALQEKDLEPPRTILEVRSMLCKDVMSPKDNDYYF